MIISEETARALKDHASEELKHLTEEEALEATEQLLAMAAEAYVSPEKEQSLGMIECQRILYRIR